MPRHQMTRGEWQLHANPRLAAVGQGATETGREHNLVILKYTSQTLAFETSP